MDRLSGHFNGIGQRHRFSSCQRVVLMTTILSYNHHQYHYIFDRINRWAKGETEEYDKSTSEDA